jgi:hypothetical protein
MCVTQTGAGGPFHRRIPGHAGNRRTVHQAPGTAEPRPGRPTDRGDGDPPWSHAELNRYQAQASRAFGCRGWLTRFPQSPCASLTSPSRRPVLARIEREPKAGGLDHGQQHRNPVRVVCIGTGGAGCTGREITARRIRRQRGWLDAPSGAPGAGPPMLRDRLLPRIENVAPACRPVLLAESYRTAWERGARHG